MKEKKDKRGVVRLIQLISFFGAFYVLINVVLNYLILAAHSVAYLNDPAKTKSIMAFKASYIYKYGDTDYTWVYNEHCVVLTGYSIPDNTITVYDSIDGIMTYNTDEFQKIYDDMWKMSVVLEPKNQ